MSNGIYTIQALSSQPNKDLLYKCSCTVVDNPHIAEGSRYQSLHKYINPKLPKVDIHISY
jgi:hypothetical protein